MDASSPSVYNDDESDHETGSESESLFDKLLEEVTSKVCFRGVSPQSELRGGEQTLGCTPEPTCKRWKDVRLAMRDAHQSAQGLSFLLKDVRRRIEIEENKWMANSNAF